MKKKILYVIDNIDFGGGERGFAQLITRINRDKFEPMVACWPEGPFIRLINGKAELIPFDFRKLINLPNIFKLKNIMVEKKVDIVHSQGTRADFYGRIAGHLAGVKTLISTKQMLVEGYDVNIMKKAIYVILDCLSERFVDHFVVVSEALQKKLIFRHGINPRDISLIYNGIELEQYNPAWTEDDGDKLRSKHGINEQSLLYVTIGRLVWQKGLFNLLKAVKVVKDAIPESICVIVGDGPLRKNLEDKADALGIANNVVFIGFMEDIRPVLSACNVLVLPSIIEGHPMIVLEAMAMGKPVVASNIDGINNQVVHNNTGLLVPHSDETQLAKAIIYLHVHQDEAKRMGVVGRKRAEDIFNINSSIRLCEDLYEKVSYFVPSP